MNTILSIAIVEYHCVNEIHRCIAMIEQHVTIPHEVIVSSNSCYTEEQRHAIDQSKSNVRWLFNARNGGFAYAMNEGLKVAKGDYLAIMNSDCVIDTDLSPLIVFMKNHPEVGAIAPKILDAEGNLQDTARPYVSLPRFVWRQTKRLLLHKISIPDNSINYSDVQTVDWLIGAFIMVSRKAYEATNGLDERFFMYAEDLDWCTRIRIHRLEVVYFPLISIIYKGTRRARSNSKYAKIFLNSHIKYWRKYGFFFGYPKRKAQVYV